MKLSKLAHYGDLFAIPFLFISVLYFYQIENKTPLEYCLMLFMFITFNADILFSYIYFR